MKINEKLMKTCNDNQARSILNVQSGTSLPKLMTREMKHSIDDHSKHIFKVNRFDEGKNVKFTKIIKRFLTSERTPAYRPDDIGKLSR